MCPKRSAWRRGPNRPGHDVPPEVIRAQYEQFRQALRHLDEEGFEEIIVLNSPEEIDAAAVVRQPLPSNRKEERGPFDIIGDVHGCFDELRTLLDRLGYEVRETPGIGLGYAVQPPVGRKAIFVGDLVDRGPKTPQVLRLVLGMVADGSALCVPGNHDDKLCRKLKGATSRWRTASRFRWSSWPRSRRSSATGCVTFSTACPATWCSTAARLSWPTAACADLQGRTAKRVRDFALYGETTGESDEFGLPVRCNWAAEYQGLATVVYGHTPVPEAVWLNRTINIDTGCVFGGKLTALRYPELELVSVAASQTYSVPKRPFLAPGEPC